MNTAATTPSPAAPAAPNAAKGNLQGQKTIAATIDRWQKLGKSLATHIDQLPLFKDQFTQFQAMLDKAQELRSRLDLARADADELIAERNRMLADGAELFGRLSLALRAVHGPQAPRLREFGLKPRRASRKAKAAGATIPPATETPATPAATHPPAAAAEAPK